VPFGGKFQIIDFALSNCVNSGIRRIGICTQYKAQSLIRHLQRGWSFLDGRFDEFVELLPAQQRIEATWYQGTADAVYQNLDLLRRHAPRYVLILAGDHVYKMDYGRMLEDHVDARAQMTIACVDVPLADASSLGVMAVDDRRRILQFQEKPAQPAPMPERPDRALASRHLRVRRRVPVDALLRDADDRFQPRLRKRHHPRPHRAGRYVPPTTSRRAASTRATASRTGGRRRSMRTGKRTCADPRRAEVDSTTGLPIWTHQEQLPPADSCSTTTIGGTAIDSIVASGCIVSGSVVRRSLLFSNVRIDDCCTIEDSVLLPNVEVGRHSVLKRVVVDKHCRLPEGFTAGNDPDLDRRRFHVTERGITLIVPEMLGPAGPTTALIRLRRVGASAATRRGGRSAGARTVGCQRQFSPGEIGDRLRTRVGLPQRVDLEHSLTAPVRARAIGAGQVHGHRLAREVVGLDHHQSGRESAT
jgi:glucose-1-phosphate adenylyltransferase